MSVHKLLEDSIQPMQRRELQCIGEEGEGGEGQREGEGEGEETKYLSFENPNILCTMKTK